MKVKINNRLTAVASLVEENSYILDVGCDHALLDIYLLQNKKNVRTIASDIKEGPLNQARANIKKYQLEDKIKVKLGDGIDTIEKEIDTVIISGMGGLNIVGILKYKTHLLKNVTTLILSPNNDVERLRKEVTRLGFYIEEELLILEHNFFYPVIRLKKGKRRYKEEEYLLGPILINKKGDAFKKYIEKELEIHQRLLQILPKKYMRRRWQLKKELKIIEKNL